MVFTHVSVHAGHGFLKEREQEAKILLVVDVESGVFIERFAEVHAFAVVTNVPGCIPGSADAGQSQFAKHTEGVGWFGSGGVPRKGGNHRFDPSPGRPPRLGALQDLVSEVRLTERNQLDARRRECGNDHTPHGKQHADAATALMRSRWSMLDRWGELRWRGL